MLVLSRKKYEKILIGDDIEVVVVEIHVDKVRLGILAPRQVPVDREEVRKSKLREAAAAVEWGTIAETRELMDEQENLEGLALPFPD